MAAPERWFHPRKHTGWKKEQSAETRRKHLWAYTDKRYTLHKRYVQAARKILALANVTQDPETRKKARADADYFLARARSTKD